MYGRSTYSSQREQRLVRFNLVKISTSYNWRCNLQQKVKLILHTLEDELKMLGENDVLLVELEPLCRHPR